ncbi:hypothetical protein BT96DRAFT_999319 [Gymnopus androsaceus JB14]|uniref:Uncharacterized protein n=1 Tax=Gymnopus androsaceus JB14 TaxID=1447944 RepID=A0A6A4H605_9AGAR|nr:hypothetical protein BT96DRAFT_999319 [Gymnopus androsaceus JB14]
MSFCHLQTQLMKKKSAAAEVHVLAHDLLEVVITQDYPPDPAPKSASDEPMAYEGGTHGSGWVNSDNDSEDEVEDTEVEKTARKVRVEYQDFHTNRQDRTDKTSKYWEQQTAGMVDAYMDWCCRNTMGEPLPTCGKPSLWINVVDVFGTDYREVPHTNNVFDSASLIRSAFIMHCLYNVHISQLFTKTLCDLEGVAFRPYISS